MLLRRPFGLFAVAIVLAVALALGCTSETDYRTVAEEIADRDTAAVAGTAESSGASSAVYVVQAGDTLARIAAAERTTVSALAAANAITDIDRIEVGQRLLLPDSLAPAVSSNQDGAEPAEVAEEAARTSDDPAADEPDLLSALPRRLDLDGGRGPAYILLVLGGMLTTTAMLIIVLVAARSGLGYTASGVRVAGVWLLDRSRAGPASRRVARWFAGGVRRASGATAARAARSWRGVRARAASALPARLAGVRIPSVRLRDRRVRVPVRRLFAWLGFMLRRGVVWLAVWSGRALRWLARVGYRGANRTARQGRATAERAIEQRREQRRAQERAAELERLAALGVAQLRLGLLDEADREIRAALDELDDESPVERGVCMVRLAEVLIRRDDHGGAARYLDEGLEAMGAHGPPEAYQQVQTLRLRLRAAAPSAAPVAVR